MKKPLTKTPRTPKATTPAKECYFAFDPNEDVRSYGSMDALLMDLRNDVDNGVYESFEALEDIVIVRGTQMTLVVDSTVVLRLEEQLLEEE